MLQDTGWKHAECIKEEDNSKGNSLNWLNHGVQAEELERMKELQNVNISPLAQVHSKTWNVFLSI